MLDFATDEPPARQTPAGLTAPAHAEDLRERVYPFFLPVLAGLDLLMDVRLVRTFWQTIETMLQFRHRVHVPFTRRRYHVLPSSLRVTTGSMEEDLVLALLVCACFALLLPRLGM